MGGVAKFLDISVAAQVLGDGLADDTCTDAMNDVDLGHVVEQGLIDKLIQFLHGFLVALAP